MLKICKPIGYSCVIGLIKTSIWRFLATGVTFIIMFINGIKYDKSLVMAVSDTILKFFLFFIFDRSWEFIFNKIKSKNICGNTVLDNNSNNIETPTDIEIDESVDNNANNIETPGVNFV